LNNKVFKDKTISKLTMTSHKQTEQETTKFQDLDVTQLSFTELAENDRSKSQLIAYPRYGKNGQALMLQAPWIKLDDYGVPRMSEYIKSDADRAKLKIPLNSEHPESQAFHDKLVELDNYLGSQEMKDKFFGKKAAKYKYIPIVRSPLEEDEEDENKKKSKRTRPYPPYLKPKVDTTWPETKIKSKIFKSTLNEEGKRERTANVVPVLDDEGKNVVDEDGNLTYRPIESVTEYAEFVTYQSNVRPIISPVKLWAQKKPSGTDPMMQYGLMFKIIKMEVEPGAGSGNSLIASYRNNDKFIDSEDEEESSSNRFKGPPPAPSKSALPLKKVSQPHPPADDEEEEEEVAEEEEVEEVEEEEEEEPEPEPPKPVAKGKGKAPTRKQK